MTLPIERVHFFTDEVRSEILSTANQIMPPSVGYRVTEIKLFPFPARLGQQVTTQELIGRVNRLRGSRAEIGVRLGAAKELLETTCRLILGERNPSLRVVSSWGVLRLLEETEKVLTMVPAELCQASQEATQKILEKLSSLVRNLEVEGLDARQAGLAVWATVTLTMYLIDSHQPPMGQTRGSRWL